MKIVLHSTDYYELPTKNIFSLLCFNSDFEFSSEKRICFSEPNGYSMCIRMKIRVICEELGDTWGEETRGGRGRTWRRERRSWRRNEGNMAKEMEGTEFNHVLYTIVHFV